MATVYILYSDSIHKFYIGSCLDLTVRLQQHLDGSFDHAFTKRATDWVVFLTICDLHYQQARAIEQHIKSMKSSQYIRNLKAYPELRQKLIKRFT